MASQITNASGAAPESVLERLLKTSPALEVWWDSSPLVYQNWANELINQYPMDKQADITEQLRRLYDPENPTATLFTGVTTNPPLSLNAMKNDPERWAGWIANYQKDHPEADHEEVFWELYKEIVRLGADAFFPLFESSVYNHGYLSGQVDPRNCFDGEKMLKQGLELAALRPNVMVKIPGTKEGVAVIRELTSRGISTNLTSGFTIPQFVAVAEAVQDGLDMARSRGINLSRWRSVVTDMSARWENAPEFANQAKEMGIELSAEDIRWAGVAKFKKAHQIFREKAYPSKMLICSVRMGPEMNGSMRCLHLEETAGASAVFTLPPNFLSELFTKGDHLHFESRIWEDIPAEVMQKLQQIPYFKQSYEPYGLTLDEFNSIPALLSTAKEFSNATQKMVDFVKERMIATQRA